MMARRFVRCLRTFVRCHSCQETAVCSDGMRANLDIGDEVPTGYIRAERTSPQVLTLKARLLQASRVVHRRLLSAADAKASLLGLIVPTDCGTNRNAGKRHRPQILKK